MKSMIFNLRIPDQASHLFRSAKKSTGHLLATPPIPDVLACAPSCSAGPGWMPFRTFSGTFGSALRPESSTGTPHHFMGWGIERTAIFRDDTDRAGFLGRLAGLVERAALMRARDGIAICGWESGEGRGEGRL